VQKLSFIGLKVVLLRLWYYIANFYLFWSISYGYKANKIAYESI
jgi:hypothetical protein